MMPAWNWTDFALATLDALRAGWWLPLTMSWLLAAAIVHRRYFR